MRILLVCKTLPHTFSGGIQTHTWKLSEHLIQRGHTVHILTSGTYRKGLHCREMEGRTLIEVPYLPLGRLSILPTLADEWAFNQAAAKWMLAHVSAYDLVHLQGRSGCLVLKEKANLPVPVLCTLHGFKADEYAFETKGKKPSMNVRQHQTFATHLEDLGLQKADHLIVVSRFLEEKAKKRVGKADNSRISVIPNGIEVTALNNLPYPKSGDLLFVGRLNRLKGLFELLEALSKTPPEIRLRILGDGEEKQALQQKVRDLGLWNRVFFAGAQPQTVVMQEIEAAFALILPSFLETQGIVLMEANVHGRAVLASDIPGIQEVVEHGKNGLLFPVGNIDAMAKQITHLFQNPTLAQQLGEKGHQIMRDRFSWQHIAEATESLYTKLCQKQAV